MQKNSFLLYGAYGYTGELITRFASRYNLLPVLAGRRKEALSALSARFGFPYKVIDLNDGSSLQAALREVPLVLHAAGPFEYTAGPMIDACLKTGAHYLDINGDIAVFEMLKQYNAQGIGAGIMIMPGVGFDIVPTDCLAFLLKKLLPDAVELKLAFASLGGGLSHGTAATMAGKLGEGGAVRKNGRIVRRPLGEKGFWVDFGLKKLWVMSIPWGDISTAYFTTGIPDIETYTAISPGVFHLLKLQGLFNWLLRTSLLRRYIRKRIDNRPAGPSDEMREKAISLVWGQATNSSGKTAQARMSGPEGYSLTAHSALIIVKKVLEGIFQKGYQTPANLFGENLVLEIPDVKREIL